MKRAVLGAGLVVVGLGCLMFFGGWVISVWSEAGSGTSFIESCDPCEPTTGGRLLATGFIVVIAGGVIAFASDAFKDSDGS